MKMKGQTIEILRRSSFLVDPSKFNGYKLEILVEYDCLKILAEG